ncbi:MAG: CHAD domain-containing protein [Anaerolineaceae bacterium]|jgi:CHAD domain-containing protein
MSFIILGEETMKGLSDDSVRIFGAAILMRHLWALEAEIKGVRGGGDIENIHRMRVASRRFRSAFPLFASAYKNKHARLWKQEVRSITSSLGSARDADVQIEHLESIFSQLNERRHQPGVKRLLTRLQQQRSEQQHHVLRSLDQFEKSGVIEDISKTLAPYAALAMEPFPYSRNLYQLSQQAIQKCQQLLLSYEPYIHQPERVQELHAMRVAAKKLRYTLEIFAPLYPDPYKKAISVVKELQEMLGAIHDMDVWTDLLPRFIEEERLRTIQYYNSEQPMSRLRPGLSFLLELHKNERQRLYHDFIERWDRWTQQGPIWGKLDEIIARPLSIGDDLYPPGNVGDQHKWTS